MKLKNQSGFGVIEIIIVVIIIAVIGLLGWYVMSAQRKAAAPSAVDTTNNSQTSGATKYLTIKEWGVKFSLTTDTADAYYDTKTSSPLNSMSLRSHTLDSEPDCTNAPQSVSTIFRVPKDAPDSSLPSKKYSETQDGTIIDNYFYFIQSAQTACTTNPDKQIILQAVHNSFNTAGPTIQKS